MIMMPAWNERQFPFRQSVRCQLGASSRLMFLAMWILFSCKLELHNLQASADFVVVPLWRDRRIKQAYLDDK